MPFTIVQDGDKYFKEYSRNYWIKNGTQQKAYVYRKIQVNPAGIRVNPDGTVRNRKVYQRVKKRSDIGKKHVMNPARGGANRKKRTDKGKKRTHYVMVKRAQAKL